MRRHTPRVSSFAAGVIGAIVIFAACYLVFGGSVPFSGSPFELKAMFTTQTELHIPSVVRIAGVDVGQVVSVQRVSSSSTAAVITMDINSNGLPIHADATAKIRPRLFLEGNFYVELTPGTPSSPTLKSGATLPAVQTSGPVQLDRVLAALRSDTRANLQTLLQGLGSALNGQPTQAQDATQDVLVRGLTGGQSLNESLKYSADAFKASTIVNEALLGQQPHDLSRVVVGNSRVFGALASQATSLASFVTTFNATMATLASRQQELSQTIALLPPLLQNTNNADTALDSSFGPTKRFAQALLPSIKQLDPTIGAGLPWLDQSIALFSKQELGGLLSKLTPAVQQTASSLNATKAFIGTSDQLTRCFLHNLTPTGDAVIQDPPIGTGLAVYQELFQTAVGLASASQNFDGNGRYVRSNATGGGISVKTPPLPGSSSEFGPTYGNAVLQPLGTRPAWPGKAPPLRRDVPCYKNAAPNLNNVRTGAGP
jgi:phospholipid/cholesterol/gamma-HCH transport system substrate-binding protein